jgi:hypothetical protein
VLKLAGVQLHPGVRVLIGGALIALGVALDGAVPMIVIGSALVLWGIVAVLGAQRSR